VHGDFSNVTFVPDKQFSGVFDLQGRVGLDANQNEQRAILQHYLRTAIADLVGPAAGPTVVAGQANQGFRIDLDGKDLTIGAGRYYVEGIAVQNDLTGAHYSKQPPFDRLANNPYAPPTLPDGPYLAHLKVWERHVTEIEDPSLHETALGLLHPDSSSRSQVTWQVGAAEIPPEVAKSPKDVQEWVRDWLDAANTNAATGLLKVRARRPEDAEENPCTAGPEAAYLGENQLYRVEVRKGGTAADGATFVWSRDNGSVVYPIVQVAEERLVVDTLGRDWHTTLDAGAWVEVVDDAVSLRPGIGRPAPAPALRLVTEVDPESMTVVLDAAPPDGVGGDRSLHPYLRRWDMLAPDPQSATTLGAATADGVPIMETAPPPAHASFGDGLWIPLERGVEVQFLPGTSTNPQTYRSGDYWTFPARRTLADVVFDHPSGQAPQGVPYHYAALAVVDGASVAHLRQLFAPALTTES